MNSKKQAQITILKIRKLIKGRCSSCGERRTFTLIDTKISGGGRFEVWAICSCQTIKFKGAK